jgi:16S rRNA (uracil1498-N3)-methyltransferase
VRRLFVGPEQRAHSTVKLTPEQSRYLAVLRLAAGSELEIFDGQGGRSLAQVVSPLELLVLRELPRLEQRRLDVVLVQALAKSDKLEFVVQKATELGVSRIVPLATERAVVKLDPARGASRAERWRKVAQEAARQCGRADVPGVDEPTSWSDLFRMLHADPDRRALLLDPQEQLRLSTAARGAPSLLLAVGPEGGFAPEEQERALAEGFVGVGLGPLVLRTETAGLAALAVVQHLYGQLG